MSSSSAMPGLGGVDVTSAEGRQAWYDVTAFWWLYLVVGVAWIAASLVILQFDGASVRTIGLIVGVMFIASGLQQLAIAAAVDTLRWLWVGFALLFLVAGVVCLLNPEDTFAGLADILGFLFLTVGVWWAIRSLLTRSVDPLWWVGLIAAVLMLVMAFWTGGQFFLQRSYTLLVFGGIWALMQGITDIVRAFQVRSLHKAL
jgi:uncharacterized membrane protein HdeD (DUF308 family)